MSGTTQWGNVGIRTYGRVTDPVTGARFWVQVLPDAGGYSDSIYTTALIQAIKLNWGESPFYGDWGVPARESVNQQVPPDYAMTLTQQRFAQYFMSLQIARASSNPPTYTVQVQYHNGASDAVTMVPQPVVDGLGQAIVDGHGWTVSTGQVTSGRFIAT